MEKSKLVKKIANNIFHHLKNETPKISAQKTSALWQLAFDLKVFGEVEDALKKLPISK